VGDGYQTVIVITVITNQYDPPPPVITTISPNSGTISENKTITISGNYLDTAYQVFVDLNNNGSQDNGEQCTSANVVSITSITCNTPTATTSGAYNVVVKTWGGTATLTNGFTYTLPAPTITSISPNRGPNDGRTTITITGANFIAGATVAVGGTNCPSLTVNSSTQITCTPATKANGAYAVVATTANGTSNTNVNFTYETRTMQNTTKANCPTATTAVADTRDGHYYYVQKMVDGNCWMLTNLAYAGGQDNHGNAFTINHFDGGISPVYWTAGTIDSALYVDPYLDSVTNGGAVNQSSGTACPKAYSATASLSGTECGYLYSWYAATAGTGKASLVTEDPTASICPVGWHLPTGSPNGEFAYLNAYMAGLTPPIADVQFTSPLYYNNWLPSGAWRGVLSGIFMPSAFYVTGLQGAYWTSSTYSSTFTWSLVLSDDGGSGVYPGTMNSYKYFGFAVRCLAVS
jgi:uncharacterized protein (TIGR02145 family)